MEAAINNARVLILSTLSPQMDGFPVKGFYKDEFQFSRLPGKMNHRGKTIKAFTQDRRKRKKEKSEK